MVAVVTGNNLGLVAGSAGVLGSNGQLGSAATGRGGDAAFVNATTGNLTIQRQDELLIGVGPDIGIVRTYNSKGTFDFDNNDNWQISLYRRVFGVTGTVNTAGSTIKRTGADGAELIHTYDTTLAKYVNKDGSGSFNTLTYNAGTNAWTWVNGDSRTTEAYELQTTGTYRIKTLADSDGNILTYSYDAATSLITQVADANGEKTQLIYNTTTKQLSQINVVNSSNVTTTRVRYTYDTNTPIARLISVSTDLTPVDGSIADGNAYVTTYAYVGTTNLVSSITNSDGTKTSFTYDASNRVATVTDGTGYITNFAYPSSTTATITDAASQVTTLTYSAVADGSIGQLTGIQDPSGSGQNILYAYDTSGNVTQMTDSRGNVTKYTYDTNGNQTRQEDALGNTITRTFSATNQLLSETVYATPDTVPGDTTYNAALPQTTRYVYDDSVGGTNNRLRFMISPEGRVTEYQYNAVGQRIVSIQYAGLTSIATNLYTTAGTPTEAQMTSWAGATDKTKSQRSDYGYDVRGQLSTRSTYTTVNAAGAGVVDATTATTQYVYDQNGNLVQAIDARGVATTAITTDFITSYSYDGLNRLVSQTDALGNVTTSVFDDTSNRQVKVTLANGLVTTSSYDAAGRLLSVSNGQAATPTALGTISYLYNNLGQLRQIIDPTGQKTYYIYDSLGRKVGAIDPQLALTEYVYNNNNQVVRIIQYTNAVTATLNATTALTITLASTRPVLAATTDRLDRNLYDKVGRLAKQVSAVGAVTEYQYDGASRLVTTIGYANLLSVAQLNALAALSTEPLATDANTIPVADATNDRRARQFYSDDGLLAATLDGEGYLTEYTYNAAGQRTSSIRYGTITPSAQWVSGALSALRPALDVNNDQTSYNIYNARGQLEGSVDALGYLTEYQYDTVGNRTLTTRYATSITYTVGVSVAASRPADALTNSENQSSTTTYDANNRVTSNTSAPDGLITNYSYDTVGNLTQKVNTFSGATALDNRSQFKQYDQLGRVTRELSGEGVLALQALVSPTQVQIDAVWDSYGNRYTYDLAGRVMAATTANGANTTGNKSLYYYDNEGKLKYQVNALGEVTQYNYNNFDNTTTTRRYNTRIVATTLATMTGGFATAVDATITALVAGGYSDTLAAYSNLGQTTTLTDALANANSRSYNAFGERKDTTNKIDASTTNITSYVYDRRGMVKTTTEDSAAINRITQAVYDAFGRITQTTDGRGGIVKRSYDKLGREVSVWDANSNAASLTTNNSFTTYDAFSRVLTRRDGRGVAGGYNTVSYSYNSTARSMTMTTAEGVSMITTKNRFGETVQITDGRNNVTTYTYNTDGQLKSTTTPTGTVATPTTSTNTTTYDAAGHVTTTTDARGINTTFSYDAANRVLSRTVDPTSLNPTGLNLITQYSYDALGRQTWVKDAKGVWTRTDYDAKGQVTSMVVDPSTIPVIDAVTGLVTTTTANATGLNITTNFTYDARGKRLTVVEAAGSSQPKTTQYLYDKLGRLTQTAIDPAGLNLRTSYSYDKNDNVVLKTDANGNKTVYSYDANNRLIYTVDALGDVSKNDYDIDGNVLTTTKYATPLVAATLTTLLATPSTAIVPTVNAAADLVTRNVYDKDNRRSFGIDALGYVTKYEYDANRNVTKTTQYGNAMVGAATAGVAPRILATAGTGNYVVISANDQVTQMTYDAANRAITSTDALGITTSYTYDANGNQLSVTEGVGTASQRITRQEFDAMGRKTAAVDALGYRTETTYDALGNIVTVKDAKGAMGYFYYDAASRMTLQVNPEGAVTETLYNALGNQTDIIRYATKFVGTLMVGTKPAITANVNLDQRQVVTYDAASRKLNIKTAFANTGGQTLDSTAGTGNAYIESFTYDAFGNVLTSIARNGASTTYSYDALNRKVTETLPINSKNASNVLTVVQNSFVYDTFGNLSTKTEAVGLPEQRMTTYVYDLLNRQTQEIGQTFTSFNPITQANVSVIPTRTKTYDARGNVTSETDANNNKTIYYYDSLDRRIGSVTTDGVYTKWTYDAVGNKISQIIYTNKVSNATVVNLPAVTADATNDRTTAYTYDAVGHQTVTEIQNITFGSVNTANQYIVSTGSIKTITSYDALGNVIKVVDANNALLLPTDPNYRATRIWYNNAGQSVAQADNLGYLTTWARDVYGNITRETRYAKKPSAAATPLIVTDATTLAQLTTTAATLTDTANDRITDITFDKLNRVVTESKLNVAQGSVSTTNGALTATTAAATTSYTYDALNNVLQKTDAVGAVTNWVYDGISRQISQLNPTITDNLGAAVRPETDKEYYGLGNVKRELARGTNSAVAATNSGQVETDDHITQYEYDVAGRLSAMVDAMGARTEYKYDANGNLTKSSLKGRLDADGVVVGGIIGDTTIYSYDAQNRQTKTQDISTGLISEVQYNSFNQIAGKRTYTSAAPTSWQEFAQYDQAGRAWKTNSGDGVTKVSIYDQNGNATLSISGTLDMRNMSLSQVLAQKAADTTAGVAQQTLYTMSAYDAKNELINTIQPSMASTKDVVVVQVNTSTGSMFVGNNSSVTINSSLAANVYANNAQIYPGHTSGEVKNYGAFAVIKSDGSVVTWGDASIGGNSSVATYNGITGTYNYVSVASQLNGSIKVTQVYSAGHSFAALRADGSVVAWGNAAFGGDSSAVANQLNGSIKVTQIYSTNVAFAALRADGSVITWGDISSGGNSSAVSSQLINVTQIYSAGNAFAALRADGSVVTWGNGNWGGNSTAVASQINGSIKVTQIDSTGYAFAALRADGSVVTWGLGIYGGDSSAVASQLNGSIKVTQIYSAGNAFAALRADGSVVTWGDTTTGGNSTAVASQLINVTQIYSTHYAFAAMRADGSVVTWGDVNYGGNSTAVASQINGSIKVTQIYGSGSAFAALRLDGSVVTWGESTNGGNSSTVASQINGSIKVTQIYGSGGAFAALRVDGSVVTWGATTTGGNSTAVASQINGSIKVTQIYTTGYAFAALRADGSIVTWGGASYGGDSFAVLAQLRSNVLAASDINTNTFVLPSDFKVNITQPITTQYIDVSYRVLDTFGTYTTVRANPTAAGSGIFNWDANSLVSDRRKNYDYEVIVKAYNLAGVLDNYTQINIRFGMDSKIIGTPVNVSGQQLRITSVVSPTINQLTPAVKTTATYDNNSRNKQVNLYAFAVIKNDGSVVTWGDAAFGGDSSAVASQLNGSIKVTQIYSNPGAFAALRADGSVVSWGFGSYGGDSSAVASQLNGSIKVIQIYSTGSAFAALRADGSVVTWGDTTTGGNSTAVASQLVNVTQIYSVYRAFAALRVDGSVVTWGDIAFGGNSITVASQLNGGIKVTQIFSTSNAFAALRADGSVVTWGHGIYGGDSSAVASQLNGSIKVTQVYSNGVAFVAQRADGSIITWGLGTDGGNSTAVASQLNNVTQIYSTGNAFAALRADGSVITWGNATIGGDSTAVASQINGSIKVTRIYSTANAFAALRADGSVVTWGDVNYGGNSSAVASQLNGSIKVTQIYSGGYAFAALRVDGSVITWGYATIGGDSSTVASQLNGSIKVTQIYSTDSAFAALRADGSVVTWGEATSGGNSSVVANKINTGVLTANGIVSYDYVQLSYRFKGSNASYISLAVKSTIYNGTVEYGAAIPSTLAAGDYEYRYTHYAGDTLDANGNTILNPLGTSTGYFTVAAASTNVSRLDWIIINTASSTNTISRKQAYNAFGEVVQEIDGRGNVTDLTYNTIGKLTLKTDPIADITLANGFVQTGTRSQTSYTYDAIGRMVATKDGNLNLNTQVWLAGGNGEQTVYERHADGGVKTNKYDIFGNKRIAIDEAVRQIDYSYDNNNRLTRLDRPQRLSTVAGYMANRTYDDYTYDAAGQRITHSTSSDVSTAALITSTRQTEKTYYDSLGRVTQTKSYLGYATQYSCVYSNAVTGIGGIVGAGWVKTTTRSDGHTDIDKMDMFQHITWHQDLGGHQFTYNYNQAGWLMSQTGTSGQNIAYEHYNNGYIKAIQDKAVGMYTYYEYDLDGNKTFEGYISLKNPISLAAGAKDYYQYANIIYDAMNRIKTVVDPKASISYEYDAASNRRMVKSVYHDGVNGAMRTQEYWYTYDSMNRFLVTMGSLAVTSTGLVSATRGATAADATITINKGLTGTTTVAGGAGVAISYNLAGERVQAINAYDGSTENYVYTADGYLADVSIKLSTQTVAALRSRRVADAMGRTTILTQYSSGDATGVGSAANYSKATIYDQDSRVTSENGTDGPTTYTYGAKGGELSQTINTNGGTTVNTYYGYEYWDDAKQSTITNQAYNPTLKGNNAAWSPGYSNLTYDVNGHVSAGIDRYGNRNFRYVNDAQGLILLRDEITGSTTNAQAPGTSADKISRYYYVNGKRVGDVSNDGPSRTDYIRALAKQKAPKGNYANWKPVESADFDQNYEPISPAYPAAVPSNYTVRNGDTLQTIARSVWGDSAMWYLIADANGLASGSTLTAGMKLTIPNKVTNIHNNAGTFRPYNAGEAIGDVNPTLPAAPPPPRNKRGGCGGLGLIIVAIVAIAAAAVVGPMVAAALNVTSAIGTAVVGAAVGNVAGQVAGNILGVQSGFNFASLGTSMLTAGLTQGVLGSANNPTGLGKILQGTFSGYAEIAARAVVGNVISQGVGNLTGQQKGFSWSSVAISGLGAAAGSFAADKLGFNTGINAGNQLGKDLGRAAANAAGFALSQVVVRGGKINWQQVATDTILNFTSSRVQGYVDTKNAELVAQQRRDAGVDNEPLYSTATKKGDFTRELLNSQQVEAAQLGLASTPTSAGGLSMSYPFTPDQYMKDDNAATTAAYFKRQQPETSVNKVKNQLANINAAKEVGFDFGSVDFLSNSTAGNGRVQGSYWGNISDEGATQGNFAKYALGNTMGVLEKVGYGIYGSVSAAINSPKDGFKGARNMAVNLGPDLYNLAVNGTKTSLNGYSLLFEQSGLVGEGAFADFRNTKAYNINPLLANENQGQNGGYLLGGLALGKVVGSYGGYGVTFENINATGPLKYQAGAVNIRLTAPAFANTAEASAAAEALGYMKVEGQFSKSRQPIYRNNKTDSDLRFISPDVGSGLGSHNGGVWKAADSIPNLRSKQTRSGTYDADLNWLRK